MLSNVLLRISSHGCAVFCVWGIVLKQKGNVFVYILDNVDLPIHYFKEMIWFYKQFLDGQICYSRSRTVAQTHTFDVFCMPVHVGVVVFAFGALFQSRKCNVLMQILDNVELHPPENRYNH